ncbi:MAG TPA: alpha-E domain-containing protein [Candidatus Binatia bacterium]|nr:alpha-E domain-containing protein [Candidatus Binatia bacterium]
MLSRVANSIYWLSRYMERADNVARFVDVNLQMMLDLPSGLSEQWQPLVSISGDDAAFVEKFSKPTRENVIKFLTFEAENPNSIVSCLRAARENARTIRESISPEMWEQVNTCYLMVNAAASDLRMTSALGFFGEVKKASQLFHGITDATMLHGEGWHFYRMGRLLERADKTSRLLDVKYYILLPSLTDVGTPLDDIQWAAVLQSASALEMYRKRHGHIAPEQIIQFLVLDPDFPRSIHYCLTSANDSLHSISGTPVGMYRNSAEQRLGQLRAELAYTDMKQIIGRGLHEFLDGLQTKLNLVDQCIFDTFFALRPVSTDSVQRQNQ